MPVSANAKRLECQWPRELGKQLSLLKSHAYETKKWAQRKSLEHSFLYDNKINTSLLRSI